MKLKDLVTKTESILLLLESKEPINVFSTVLAAIVFEKTGVDKTIAKAIVNDNSVLFIFVSLNFVFAKLRVSFDAIC